MKSLLLLSAMLVAAPAMAQTATPPASTNAAQPAAAAQQAPQPATDAPTAQTPTTAQPSSPASTTTGTTGSGTTTTTTAASNSTDAVATVVSTDWAKYDGDKNGDLSKTEFASWMTALREQNPAQKAQVKDVDAWTTAAFTQADKDKSGAVSKDELQGFLKG